MKKKIVSLVMLLVFALIMVGCTTSAEHRRAHRKAISRDMTEIHRFVDKHFWNYDWNDPFYN